MIGADTNLLVRLIINDVESQAIKVSGLLDRGTALYVNQVVVSELYYVLTSVYKFSKNEFIEALDDLLETQGISFFDTEIVAETLTFFVNSNVGFTDCLINAINNAQHLETFTFDKKASTLPGMQLLE